jgi:carotenoid phi-ring synthase / carotenoid chi-ring synthase
MKSDKLGRRQEVIVIGAGVAGLSAALHLAERGVKPLLLEANPKFAGGRVSGGDDVVLDGYHFRSEHAVHGIWSPYRNLQATLTRHRIRPMFVPAIEEAWIYKRGSRVKLAKIGSAIRHSWLPAPFHYLNLFLRPQFLAMLNLKDILSLPLVWAGLVWGLGVDPWVENQPLEGMWLSDIVKGWGPGVRALFIGLARNGLAGKPEEIPLSGFVAFLRFYTLLRKDAWAFSYMPDDGGSTLADPLVDRLIELGGRKKMGVRVTHLERETDIWHVHWQAENGERGVYQSKDLILATDSPNTKKILTTSPETKSMGSKCYWPRGTASVVIRVWFDRQPDAVPEGGIFSGDFILHNFFWLHRLQNQYIRWNRETGGSAVEVHIYGPVELFEEQDSVLLTRALQDIQSAFPELRRHRIHQIIQRNDVSHTLPSIGPADQHLGIETPWENLYCCGDWVRHSSPAFFLERACVTGIEAANAVLKAKKLQQWPLLEYASPEPLAGFIQRLMMKGRQRRRRKKANLHPRV